MSQVSNLSLKRRIQHVVFRPLIQGLLSLLWLTCRVKKVIGEKNAVEAMKAGKPIIPCYWHQHHVFGAWYMLQLQKRGLKLGFLISPSRDGEVPARIAASWGATPIRGSSNRTGARAIRDLYLIMTKEGISPVNTTDGPTGPAHYFKPGAIMLAQLTQAPMLPISYAASRYWQLKSWDRFIIPKPFSSIVIAVGKPRYIAKDIAIEDQEPIRKEMEQALKQLQQEAIAGE